MGFTNDHINLSQYNLKVLEDQLNTHGVLKYLLNVWIEKHIKVGQKELQDDMINVAHGTLRSVKRYFSFDNTFYLNISSS